MATQTPNLGLTLPVGTENVSRTVINGNNTLIDTFAGQMGSNLGILETGDTATHAIAKGEYVTWKGASYTADAAISIGETLAASGGSKNLTACDKGIANALNSKLMSIPLYWDSTNNYFPLENNYPEPLRRGQLTVLGRNGQTGALYVLWYDRNPKAFRIGYTIHGNTPASNEDVWIQYIA